jgi:hypothetical protein
MTGWKPVFRYPRAQDYRKRHLGTAHEKPARVCASSQLFGNSDSSSMTLTTLAMVSNSPSLIDRMGMLAVHL